MPRGNVCPTGLVSSRRRIEPCMRSPVPRREGWQEFGLVYREWSSTARHGENEIDEQVFQFVDPLYMPQIVHPDAA